MNKQSQQLNHSEILRLVSFVMEDYGSGLEKNSFSEAFLLMLEDVPQVDEGPLSEIGLVDCAYDIYCELIN